MEELSDAGLWDSFKRFSKTFSTATRLLPREVQIPIATLYAFCRRVDDIADQAYSTPEKESALTQLDNFEQAIRKIVSEKQTPNWDPLWPRIAQVNKDWPLSIQPFLELIDGARFDLQGKKIENRQDLVFYSNLVAGSVGAMMLPFLTTGGSQVWDEIDFITWCEELEPSARDLGIAMQITNILRDVGEDLRELDRVYLPNESLLDSNITIEQIGKGIVTKEYTELLESLMEEAESRYETGLRGTKKLRFIVRPGIRAAAWMYREILNEIRRNDYDNFSKRAYTSKTTKGKVILTGGYLRRKKSILRGRKNV